MSVLFQWGMDARSTPDATCADQPLIIQTQRDKRSASNGRLSYDSQAIFTPAEMLMPVLQTRIKQRYRFTGLGINCGSAPTLKFVAAITG